MLLLSDDENEKYFHSYFIIFDSKIYLTPPFNYKHLFYLSPVEKISKFLSCLPAEETLREQLNEVINDFQIWFITINNYYHGGTRRKIRYSIKFYEKGRKIFRECTSSVHGYVEK